MLHTYLLQKVMAVHFILDTTPTQETWWGANNGGKKFRIKDNLKQKKSEIVLKFSEFFFLVDTLQVILDYLASSKSEFRK